MEEYEKNRNTSRNIKHISGEVRRLSLSFIPGGQIFNSIVDYQSEIKQQRILDVLESMFLGLEDILNREISEVDFLNENFVDTLESVMLEVQKTKSKYKRQRFAKILEGQVVGRSKDSDVNKRFVRYLSELDDLQLVIMKIIIENKHVPHPHLYSYLLSNEREKDQLNIHGSERYVRIGGKETLVQYDELKFYTNELISIGFIEKIEISNGDIRNIPAWVEKEFRDPNISEFSGTRVNYIITKKGTEFIMAIYN